MRFLLLLLALTFVGCNRPGPGAGSTTPEVSSTAPARSLVHSGQPEFGEMVAALGKDPRDPRYRNQFLNIDLEVGEVKEVAKDRYLVTGRADNVTVRVTFLVLPDLRSNLQVGTLKAGDRVDFYGELGAFETGKDGVVLTVPSGSVSRVTRRPM
jgi:hypothetical protein